MSKHKRLLVRLFVSATAFFFVAAVALGIYFSCALRRIYNDEVTRYNTVIETVPSNIIASIFAFRKTDLFQLEEHKKENIKVQL